jgi:hypothetical protein
MKKVFLGFALLAFTAASAQNAPQSTASTDKKDVKCETEAKSCAKKEGKACCKKMAKACGDKKDDAKATSGSLEKKPGSN